MRFYLISDNIDTAMGMRLAGVEGVIAHDENDVNKALDFAQEQESIGIILITDKLVSMCKERVYEMKLTGKRPLILSIPDRHTTSSATDAIYNYVKEAIGIKM
ncbi:MAG: ATP synthase subunit F [Clostridiales bacterium]|nr:ATP synthase subunit F [Clostridiales bacterium]